MEDDQQFCLRWNNHQSTIIQNFDTLLESGTLVDCTLAAEGKYLKAHKVVLSACSPYFEGLLSEHYDKHPVFILKDVKFKELKAMMDYMYRGEVNISQDQLTALLKAAESLQIKGLSDSRTDKGTGNAGNTTTGGSKDNTRPAKTASSTAAASASAAAVDIPHTSSGLTIEKNSKVPRQSIQQVSVSDQLENSASPQLRGHSSREGSQSPTRKRKRLRRRSLGNDDNSMENHEASNSSDVNMTAPALGVAPVAEEKSQADPADSIGRSALMQQLTKPADEMLQMPLEKPEPSEDMIQPKSEYQDDQESVEDLTNFDDDMNDLNEMEQDNSRAGPSHDPSQHAGMPSWHIAGDRSNASVVGAAAGPGAGDEVFLAAAEAAQAQRDSQVLATTPENIDVPATPTSKTSRISNSITPTTRNNKAKMPTTPTSRNSKQKRLTTPTSKNSVVNGSPASILKNNGDKPKSPNSKNIIIKSTASVSKKIIVKPLRGKDKSISPTKDNNSSKKSTDSVLENNIEQSTNNSVNNSEMIIAPALENESISSALKTSIVDKSVTSITDKKIVNEPTASIVDNIIVDVLTGLTSGSNVEYEPVPPIIENNVNDETVPPIVENNVDDEPVAPIVENNIVDELPTSDDNDDKSEVDDEEFRGFSNQELQRSLCYLQKWDLLMSRKILPKKILLIHKQQANNLLKKSCTRFLCTTCSKEFTRKRDLWKHVKYICGQGERFKCPYCPKYKSNVTSNVYKHIRLDHPTCRIFCIDAVTNKPFKSDNSS